MCVDCESFYLTHEAGHTICSTINKLRFQEKKVFSFSNLVRIIAL